MESGSLQAVSFECLVGFEDAGDGEAVVFGEELEFVEDLVDVVGVGWPTHGLYDLPGLVFGFLQGPGIEFSQQGAANLQIIGELYLRAKDFRLPGIGGVEQGGVLIQLKDDGREYGTNDQEDDGDAVAHDLMTTSDIAENTEDENAK